MHALQIVFDFGSVYPSTSRHLMLCQMGNAFFDYSLVAANPFFDALFPAFSSYLASLSVAKLIGLR